MSNSFAVAVQYPHLLIELVPTVKVVCCHTD